MADPLKVWCPYCAAPPSRACSADRPWPGFEREPHADRRRVAEGVLPELLPVEFVRQALAMITARREPPDAVALFEAAVDGWAHGVLARRAGVGHG